jgi:hypothetical protein
MELYNFFTELVSETEKVEELKICFEELKPICHNVQLVVWGGDKGKEWYSIIGQMYGNDTNNGDTDLLSIFIEIKYKWFNAFFPAINNLIDNN